MFYYEVLVGDLQYHGEGALTYAYDKKLETGSVVRIALKTRSVLGIILRDTPEPSFSVKSIAAVAPSPPLSHYLLTLIDWLGSYYPAPLGSIVRNFLPPSTVFPKSKSQNITVAEHTSSISPYPNLPPLTIEQKNALEMIGSTGYHMLHGVTGSGKTRIYIELTARTISLGRSAIILTPEIGLTAQLIEFFELCFPGTIYVLHSRLTAAQRRDTWYDILSATKPIVVIGPRSALFAPVHSLGLIVMDESHDQAYKSETAPHYRTERIAAKLAQLNDACIVSGTATPNIEEYYIAQAKNRPIITLSEIALPDKTPPEIRLVDLRNHNQMTRSPLLSDPLIKRIQHALASREQTLLFLNRRGTAGAILCANCGWRATCPHCDLSLTYHGDSHTMRCHVCNRYKTLPSSCPGCGATDIVLKSIGTKAVIDELSRLFPHARTVRFDTDTDKKVRLEHSATFLRSSEIDIIVGTQMITKGLDLPRLSVVGVLNADTSLLIPDYAASERTFQLLTQVIGRAGRGHRAGHVVIQTYEPTHPTITAAVTKDWRGFYDQELEERRNFRFPPFVYMMRLSCLRTTSTSAERAAQKQKEYIKTNHPYLNVEGPSVAFHPRERGKYKWQIIVKSPSRQTLVDIALRLPSGWTYDLDPINLL